MRSSHHQRGWVEDDKGQLVGLSLGFDFCAEHERGASSLYRAFGVNPSLPGFEAIRATQAPPLLQFEERKVRKPPKKRHMYFKREVDTDKLHEAVLYIGTRNWGARQDTPLFDRADQELGRMEDMRWNQYNPERQDMQAAWASDEAMVRVRGQENVDRLRTIYEAILHSNLVFNAPTAQGFTRRDGGLSFGLADRFDDAYRQKMMTDYEAGQRLSAAFEASGVVALLKEKGKSYHALSPEWMDNSTEKNLAFFLNPSDHEQTRKANFGRFTVDEIRAWANNEGPVIKDEALIDAEKNFRKSEGFLALVEKMGQPDAFDKDHSPFCLIKKAGQLHLGEDIKIRTERTCWANDAHTRVGVNVWPANADAQGIYLKAGVHDLLDLLSNPAAHIERLVETLAVATEVTPAARKSSPRR